MPQKKRWHHYWCLNSRARGGLPPWASFLEFKNCSTAAAKSLQLCLTLCDPIDGSPPGSTVPGILLATTPEWVAISPSNAWKWKVKVKLLSCVWLFATPWTAAHQAPPSMGFSRQEYWSGVPLPSLKNCSRLANTLLSIAANWFFFPLSSLIWVLLVNIVSISTLTGKHSCFGLSELQRTFCKDLNYMKMLGN